MNNAIAIQSSGKNLAGTIYTIKIDETLNGARKENKSLLPHTKF